jgi:hypothetical protein
MVARLCQAFVTVLSILLSLLKVSVTLLHNVYASTGQLSDYESILPG